MRENCPNATASGSTIRCSLIPGNVRISPRVCQRCQRQWADDTPPTAETLTPTLQTYQPSRGLGDTIAKATAAVGISPCGGCKQRQAIANTLVPYKSD